MPQLRTGLTIKQRKFIKKYAESGNGLQSALSVYDTDDPNTAKVIASENLTNPNITAEVDRILTEKGYSLQDNIGDLAAIAKTIPEKGFSGQEVLKARLESMRLRGFDRGHKTQNTNLTIKANLSEKKFQELMELKKAKDSELGDLADE